MIGKLKAPKVHIAEISFEDSYYWFDSESKHKEWKAETLVQAVKDQKCKVFDLPLAGIDLRVLPFKIDDIDDFVFQMKRTLNTDLKYPIILDWCGKIMDGWHRVAKAIIEGKITIKAVRLENPVKPDFERKMDD